jgi:multiple sugar transport system substrate-binding protein
MLNHKRSILFGLLALLAMCSLTFSAVAQDAVSIRVWENQAPAFNAATHALGDAYMAEHPNVTITFESFSYDVFIQTLQTAMPAGTEADIIQLFGTWVCGYATGGRLAPVPADVMTLEEAQDLYYAAAVDGFTCPNEAGEPTLYGLPQEFNIEYGAALVNTDIAAELGIELPEPRVGWATWDDFIAAAEQMVEGDATFMTRAGYHFTDGDAASFTFLSLIAQQGGEFFDEDTTTYDFTTPEAQSALELMVSMVQEHNLVNPDLFNDDTNTSGTAFAAGQAATILRGPWIVPEEIFPGAPDFADNIEYIRLPSLGDEPVFKADSGWGLNVSVNSQVQEQAWDFVKFAAADPTNALAWNITSGTLPALRSLAEDEATRSAFVESQPWVEPFMDIFPYGQFIGHLPDRDLLFYDILVPHIFNAMLGVETIDEALLAIETEANGGA